MFKRILLLIVCVALISSMGFAKNPDDYKPLVGKTVKIVFKFTKLMAHVGVVVRVDEEGITYKRLKDEWLQPFKEAKPKARGFGKYFTMEYRGLREIYLLEEGKEPELYDPVKLRAQERAKKQADYDEKIKDLKIRTFFLDKILVTPTRKKHKPLDDKLSFEDELIHVSWVPLQTEFYFVIKNKSEFDKITISWDDCSFVDLKAESHRIIHKGVKMVDRSKSMPPSVLPPETKLDELLVPADNLYYSDAFRKWEKREIYKFRPNPDENENPQTLRVILCIKTDKEKFDYSFYFKSTSLPFGELPKDVASGLKATTPADYLMREIQ